MSIYVTLYPFSLPFAIRAKSRDRWEGNRRKVVEPMALHCKLLLEVGLPVLVFMSSSATTTSQNDNDSNENSHDN